MADAIKCDRCGVFCAVEYDEPKKCGIVDVIRPGIGERKYDLCPSCMCFLKRG